MHISLVTAWITLVFFGFFSLNGIAKFLGDGLSKFHGFLWFVAIMLTAISAGIIWG